MKYKIVLYLFLFVLIILIFQFVNSNRILTQQESLLAKKAEQITALKSSLEKALEDLDKQRFFSLVKTGEEQSNQREYYENIKSQLLFWNENGTLEKQLNLPNDWGKVLIDKVHVLNTEWIIASFTDGSHRGEMWLSYKNSPTSKIQFSIEKTLLLQP